MISYSRGAFIFVVLLSSIVQSRELLNNASKFSSNATKFGHKMSHGNIDITGKRWAVLVAGSRGYDNYRHQADVCHAYQVMRKGGLEDDNIIVFMYDDIAFDVHNPSPGIIINKPNGNDVYEGVPKDYTGHHATVDNFFAVLLGNKSALSGGSGKVVDSGPHDHIFIYYADHGSPGLVGMPYGDDLYAKDLIDVLKKMHAAKAYKSMVFYLEACEAGSMFEGLLPSNLSIYAVTAANPAESSYGTYCPDDYPSPPPEYDTCLGDLFSVSWMEDSDLHDLRNETVGQQYRVVRRRTGPDNLDFSSHVMEYGDMKLRKHLLFFYMGTNPANDNYSFSEYSSLGRVVDQRNASLLHFWHKFRKAPEGSLEKVEAQKELLYVISHRRHVDHSIKRVTKILFGKENATKMLKMVRSPGQPLVDDWDCLKMLVRTYEEHCGPLSWYGKKYTRALANMCNAGVNVEQMIKASTQACSVDTLLLRAPFKIK